METTKPRPGPGAAPEAQPATSAAAGNLTFTGQHPKHVGDAAVRSTTTPAGAGMVVR